MPRKTQGLEKSMRKVMASSPNSTKWPMGAKDKSKGDNIDLTMIFKNRQTNNRINAPHFPVFFNFYCFYVIFNFLYRIHPRDHPSYFIFMTKTKRFLSPPFSVAAYLTLLFVCIVHFSAN
jgi:hypothetical protein